MPGLRGWHQPGNPVGNCNAVLQRLHPRRIVAFDDSGSLPEPMQSIIHPAPDAMPLTAVTRLRQDSSSPAGVTGFDPSARTLGELLGLAAQQPQSLVADAHGAERHSWAEVDAAADRLACGMLGLGLKRGERIAVLMPNQVESLCVLMAAARIGLVVVALPPTSLDSWLLPRLAEGPVKAAFASGLADPTEPLAQLARLQPHLPFLRHVIAVNGQGLYSLSSLAATPIDPIRLEGAKRLVQPGDAYWADTSPKALSQGPASVLSQRRLLEGAQQQARQMQLCRTDLMHLATPVHLADTLACMLAVMVAGGNLLLLSGHRPERLPGLMTRLPATVLAAAPQLLDHLVSATASAQIDFSRLRLIACRGLGANAELRARLDRRMPNARRFDLNEAAAARAA